LYVGAGKAGGILCEARARGSVTRLVIGCGLNLRAPAVAVGQATSGLFADATSAREEELVAALGTALLEATDRLLRDGFEPFRQAWSEHDLLLARAVVIHDDNGETTGIARGIDSDGALLVELDQEPGAVKRLLSEEVSVRPLP
jgi:BirA family transcriptional regulator, biotin operon repressor / biotin---[acetyl-CoA-carboxylase] ligase